MSIVPGRDVPEVPQEWVDAALSELVEAARANAAETPPDPGAPALWARIEAALAPDSPIPLREAAQAAGVRFSVLFRVRQGRMPGPADLGAIETWLAGRETAPS